MGHAQRSRYALQLLVFAASCFLSRLAMAYAGSVANGSSADGTPGYITSGAFTDGSIDSSPADDNGGCTGCHGINGSAPSSIAIDGTTLADDGTTTFTIQHGATKVFTLTFSNPKSGGGFLVMHDDSSANNGNGTLSIVPGDATVHQCQGAASGSGSTACTATLRGNQEVMHEVPKGTSGGQVTFQFRYAADGNTACGTFTFGVWVNAVNLDNLCFGVAADNPVLKRFRITTNCDDGNGCTNDACNGASCTHTNNAASCSDGNACTTADQCGGGICGGTPVVCTPLDDCHLAGTCSGGACSNPVKSNGSACNDTNSCTTADKCTGGICGGTPVVCTPLDDCHLAGTCSGGTCSNPLKGNGSACNDNNSCTSGDVCTGGVCAGVGVTCTPPDDCHTASCSGGVCSNLAKANGSPCNDGKVCTTPDTCTGGVCGGPAKACNDGITCTVDSCSESVPGGCTVDASSCGCTKDADCDDGNACTGKETCNGGTLTCVAGKPVDCSAFTDACNTGTCAPATGACSAVPKSNGTPCSDGNACTTGDACNAGTCRPGTATSCNDGNACTVDGCTPATGCTSTPGNAGTQCRASSCTGGQQTLAAVCSGSSATCPAGAVQACAPFACGATACATACTTSSQCAPGNFCNGSGKCTTQLANGGACTSSGQCTSGFCVDGVCCGDACVGQCEACNLAGKLGSCSAVTGKPVAPRLLCTGDGTGCDGVCDGAGRTACTLPTQNTRCRAPSCDGATEIATLGEFCNGSGSCPTKRTQPCAPGVCGQTQCTGCSTNADCPAGDFCRAGVCKPLAGKGTTCSIDAECASGHCVDGVCCDSDCTGQCESCDQAGAVGSCKPVPADEDPAEGRPRCAGAGTFCGGQCDGEKTRSCVYPGPGVVCHAEDCTNGIAKLIAFCDGAGACPKASELTCPTGSVCIGTLCGGAPASCTSELDCNPSEYCAGGVCTTKKAAGTSCNTEVECNSGLCVDGVCCTQACTGQCEACDGAGTSGTCTPVKGPPHGSRQACASDGTVCGGSCDGVTADRCAFEGPATSCRAGSCKAGLADLVAFCQGNGSCAPLQQQSCDAVPCDAQAIACAGPCKKGADCAAGQFCAAGVCTGKLPNGVTCGATDHCSSGNCVDGLCCDTACSGSCEACDQADHLGECVPVLGAPRNGRPACPGSGACGGFCNGASRACSLPDLHVVCGIDFCSSGVVSHAPTCNGRATCVITTPESCDPYRCDGDGASCGTSCVADGDCSAGLHCVNGGCRQPSIGAADGGVDAGSDAATTLGTGGAPATGAGGNATAGGAGGGKGGSPPGSGGGAIVDGSVNGPDGGPPGKGSGPPKSGDDGSCGCRLATERRGERASSIAMLAALALLGARRRRRRVIGAGASAQAADKAVAGFTP